MEERIFIILNILTYMALFPIVFRSLMCIDTSKIFKKHHVGEIRLVYLFVTIVITKLTGDFILDIMKMMLNLFGVNSLPIS